jgi:hypothetical protein
VKEWLVIFNYTSKYSKNQLERLDQIIELCNNHYSTNEKKKPQLVQEFERLTERNKLVSFYEANLAWQEFATSDEADKAITDGKIHNKFYFDSENNSEKDTVDLQYMCDYYTFMKKIRELYTVQEGKSWKDREIVKATQGQKTLRELEQTGIQAHMALPRSKIDEDHKSKISYITRQAFKLGKEMHKVNYGIFPIKDIDIGPITPFNTKCSKILVGTEIDTEIFRRVMEISKNKYELSPIKGSDTELEFHIREALKNLLNDDLFEGECVMSRLTWQKRVRNFLKNRVDIIYLPVPDDSESDSEETDGNDPSNSNDKSDTGHHAIITQYDIMDPINSDHQNTEFSKKIFMFECQILDPKHPSNCTLHLALEKSKPSNKSKKIILIKNYYKNKDSRITNNTAYYEILKNANLLSLQEDDSIEYAFFPPNDSSRDTKIPPYVDIVKGRKISDILNKMSKKSSYVTKMEKYLQTKDIHPVTSNTECPCEPTFTINGNIHFTVPVCQYADSNKIAQGIMALERWDDLMIQKTKCRNFEHIANKEFECFELKCTNSTNKEEKRLP